MEVHLQQLCQHLKDKVELEVIVANHCDGGRFESLDGVRVQRLAASATIAGAPICLSLPRAIWQAKADIVHVHLPHPTAILAYLACGAPGNLICTYHSDIVRQQLLGSFIAPLQEVAFRRAKAIIATSPNLLAGSRVLMSHRERCVVVPLGIQHAIYESPHSQRASELREIFRAPIILTVGRLVYYKGFSHLIQAMAHLQERAVLLIIGDGPLRGVLAEEIEKLNLTGRVHLIGDVPDIIPYYQACDIFVLPSIARSEAFGLVQLEAMACAKPVINTEIEGSGVPFVSIHGKTGLTVPPADATALANAMDHLLRDEPLGVQLGQAGRQRVRDEFTLRKMADRTLKIYQSIFSKRSVSNGGQR